MNQERVERVSGKIFAWMILSLFIISWVCLIVGVAKAQDVVLQWNANSETVLGYKIYYDNDVAGPPYNGTGATEGGSPVTVLLAQDENPDPAVVEFTLHNLPNQRTWFVCTAYDATDESGYSNEVNTSMCSPDGLTIISNNTCRGDIDCDGDVDNADIAILAADFGRTNCLTIGD